MKAFSDWKDLFNLRMKTFDIKQEMVLCRFGNGNFL